MHLIEPFLALLEGLALIASPCILPVLPLILSASVDGGKRRPFGIIIGFVLAFSMFALASRKLVNALGIDLELIKHASLILLALFGMVLISSSLSARFSALTQRAANIGSRLGADNQGGLLSGIVIGGLIGLVWTPCAGPILAAVLVQVIRQESDLASLTIILPFAIGAGIPMLVIALLGRKAVNRLGFLTRHAEHVRKGFGILILLAVAFIASGVDINRLFPGADEETLIRSPAGLSEGLAAPYPAPQLAGIQAWLNSQPLTMQSLRGKVVLIDFWTYSCINCVRTLPYITRWDTQYRDQGLVIIGVHAPEFEFEKDVDNVKAAITQHGIRYPVALDNKLDTWTNFQNRYWPAHYLINRDGQVVYTHFGEGNYGQTENNIRTLLGLNQAPTTEPESMVSGEEQTPETYLGYVRGADFTSPQPVTPNRIAAYTLPAALPADHWALNGRWRIEGERIVAQEKGARLRMHFQAKKVFLVLGAPPGKTIPVTISLNGQAHRRIDVNRHTLYTLIEQKKHASGTLELSADAPGLEAYAFTFGE